MDTLSRKASIQLQQTDEPIEEACAWKDKEIGDVTRVVRDKELETCFLPAAFFSRDLNIKGDRANESSGGRITKRR